MNILREWRPVVKDSLANLRNRRKRTAKVMMILTRSGDGDSEKQTSIRMWPETLMTREKVNTKEQFCNQKGAEGRPAGSVSGASGS